MIKQIPLSQGKIALVDDADYEWLNQWKWSASNMHHRSWYAVRVTADNKPVLMHRAILNAPKGQMVDHINGDGLDNRRSNLRLATNAQNLFNRGKNRNNTSGFKGVSWSERFHKWTAFIKVNRKSIFVGHFDSAREAAIAYNAAAREYFGEFAYQNPLD